MLSILRAHRLQVNLIWLAFVASMPAFILLFWVSLDDRETVIERTNDALARAAHIARLDQEKRLAGLRQSLKLLASIPTLRTGDVPACNALLNDLLDRQSAFYNYGVFNVDGSLRCSAIASPAAANLAGQQWFVRALGGRSVSASDYVLSQPPARQTLQRVC